MIRVLAISAMLLAGGCASTSKQSAKRPEVYGPSVGSETLPVSAQPYGPAAPDPQYGPAAQVRRPVVLVLGPGLARGYSYTGVIRALSDAKIKIGAIIGTEMGALIGSLYAMDGSVNKLEWGVQRFRSSVFESDTSVLSNFLDRNPAEKLEESLNRFFGERDLSQCKIPMRILIQPAGMGAKVYDQGMIRALVRASLGNSDRFPPGEIDGIPAGTAAALRPFDVRDAKNMGIGPVIAVSVLDPKESDLFPELKEADLVLQPDVHAIDKLNFKRRTDAVFAGKAAALAHLDEIKKLVGGASP